MPPKNDSWSSGNPYEKFMGRWSRLIAHKFFSWLVIPPKSSWLDVGCGTGALTEQILHNFQPREIIGVDASSDFIAFAQQAITAPSVQFKVGLAQSLDIHSNSIDAVVSGLALNFVPHPEEAVSEMIRVTKPGGQIGIFLWDNADGMKMLRYFWDAAIMLDDNAKQFDEGIRFPLCREGQLEALVRNSDLKEIEAAPIDVITIFKDFDDYWQPFLNKVGPAPSYLMSLPPKDQQKIEGKLRQSLPIAIDGSISLNARAWAVKGSTND